MLHGLCDAAAGYEQGRTTMKSYYLWLEGACEIGGFIVAWTGVLVTNNYLCCCYGTPLAYGGVVETAISMTFE